MKVICVIYLLCVLCGLKKRKFNIYEDILLVYIILNILLSQFVIQFKLPVHRVKLEKQTFLFLMFLVPDITSTY